MTHAQTYLEHAIRTGRIPTATCIVGPQEDERLMLTRWFVEALCPVETVTLTPLEDEAIISVKVVRNALSRISRSTFTGGVRVVTCAQADLMNASAGNALLKCLEEPPAHTVFIFSARTEKSILPTIASRCQVLRLPAHSLPPLEGEDMKKYIARKTFLREPLWRQLEELAQNNAEGEEMIKTWELFIHYALHEEGGTAQTITTALRIADGIREARMMPVLVASRTIADRIILSSA